MKKYALVLLFLINSIFTFADEGMWIPSLLKMLNEQDMQSKGLKLTAEDLYSINKSSLKDAIVHFGGGCTAEIISNQGLLLTNHHCGYGQIQFHSTVAKDYLTDGFWAKTKQEELPNLGLTASIIVRIDDVTNIVLQGVSPAMTEVEREKIISDNTKKHITESLKGSHYEAYIKPFFYGNQYFMFVQEVFKDVRLVGAPPSSIGKFGGDTDNWMWPRHTGDFSMFRIYADKDNKPAEYSTNNVPYVPKNYLKISMKGVKEGDFTFVYGFPGRTTEFLTSNAVDLTMNQSDPDKIALRDARLTILRDDMANNDTVRIKYSADYASIANYWKKWQGEVNGLKKLNALEKKKLFENDFKAMALNTTEYKNVLDNFTDLYTKIAPVTRLRDYYFECVLAVDGISFAGNLMELYNLSKDTKATKEQYGKAAEKVKNAARGFYKDYDYRTDKKIMVAMLKKYYTDIDKVSQPKAFLDLVKKHNNDFEKLVNEVYKKSTLPYSEKFLHDLEKPDAYARKLDKEPLFALMRMFSEHYSTNIKTQYATLDFEINKLMRTYVKAQMELFPKKIFYPDANSTLRVAYGKVATYYPRDGVKYNYFTTLTGVMEKENPKVDEFVVHPKLKELYNKKDFGKYAAPNGEMWVAFTASNHTTGGNSGSPVLNANGELIGANFDRAWESTMSDIMFDPDQCRNIVCDIRYILFVVDKFAGAGHLVEEMTLVN